ncbi:hypothetical protein E2C01_016099 [Portunus trituberculatus]|uniref:Uncharacterized protein n=1 Tax=Portunus trituberculatus TaxID=210409 RepID=A0A5B7DN65_PORTR|nr:hypothetical protein [Portunus trituberculatus]
MTSSVGHTCLAMPCSPLVSPAPHHTSWGRLGDWDEWQGGGEGRPPSRHPILLLAFIQFT